MLPKSIFLTFGLALCLCQISYADIIAFDLTDPSGVGGTAGEGLESSGSFSQGGITVSESTASTFAGATGSAFSANSGGAGVNSSGTSADSASDIDALETLTLTFTFAFPTIQLTTIDFSGQTGGQTGGDQIFANVAGVTTNLFTGAIDFNGSTDTWTPIGGISITSGQTIVLTGEDVFDVSSITFETAAVPEPTSLITLGMFLGVMSRRRRTKLQQR